MAVLKTELECHNTLKDVIWGKTRSKIKCPICGSLNVDENKKNIINRCKNCKKSFLISKNTIFEYENIPLEKWFLLLKKIAKTNPKIYIKELSQRINIEEKDVVKMLKIIKEACTNYDFRRPL